MRLAYGALPDTGLRGAISDTRMPQGSMRVSSFNMGAVNQQRAPVMTDTVYISEAVLNGILYLKEEGKFGKGSARDQAAQKIRAALMRDNERAALYWREVMTTLRMLEHRTARTKLLKVA